MSRSKHKYDNSKPSIKQFEKLPEVEIQEVIRVKNSRQHRAQLYYINSEGEHLSIMFNPFEEKEFPFDKNLKESLLRNFRSTFEII